MTCINVDLNVLRSHPSMCSRGTVFGVSGVVGFDDGKFHVKHLFLHRFFSRYVNLDSLML